MKTNSVYSELWDALTRDSLGGKSSHGLKILESLGRSSVLNAVIILLAHESMSCRLPGAGRLVGEAACPSVCAVFLSSSSSSSSSSVPRGWPRQG